MVSFLWYYAVMLYNFHPNAGLICTNRNMFFEGGNSLRFQQLYTFILFHFYKWRSGYVSLFELSLLQRTNQKFYFKYFKWFKYFYWKDTIKYYHKYHNYIYIIISIIIYILPFVNYNSYKANLLRHFEMKHLLFETKDRLNRLMALFQKWITLFT